MNKSRDVARSSAISVSYLSTIWGMYSLLNEGVATDVKQLVAVAIWPKPGNVRAEVLPGNVWKGLPRLPDLSTNLGN